MSASITVSPALYYPIADPRTWLSRISAWHDLMREVPELTLVAPTRLASTLAAAGIYPDYPTILGWLQQVGSEAATPSATQVVASLVSRFRQLDARVAIGSWSANGCVAGLNANAASLCLETLVELGQTRPRLATCGDADSESVRVEVLDADGGVTTANLDILCTYPPHDVLTDLDTYAIRAQPMLAVRVARIQLAAGGGGNSDHFSRFQILDQLAPSLDPLSPAEVRSVFNTMAVVLGPRASWPKGLDEHHLLVATKRGKTSSPRKCHWGVATRVKITQHGAGWRLHFWAGSDGITFSNVCKESEDMIFE